MSTSPSSRHHGRLELPFLRKQAKRLLKALNAGHAPDEARQLAELGLAGPAYQLADAQWLTARAQGFASWPRLKAHADALDFAARHPGPRQGDSPQVIHWRCGNDIEHSLKVAGFTGQFRMLSDPLAMGPVPALEPAGFQAARARFIAQAFNLAPADAAARLATEYGALAAIGADSEVVLWCEADAYDQLFLIRLLAGSSTQPRRLELVEAASVPGVERFIGVGQLAPDVLAWLWPQRRALGAPALALGRKAWAAYCAPDPRAWASLAAAPTPPLPLLGPALARQLQELPRESDGLSLTERLSLHHLAERGPMAAGQVFAWLMKQGDPLPWLGDMMFEALSRHWVQGPEPLLHEAPGASWAQRQWRLAPLAERVLAGQAHWLDHVQAERWVGGVQLSPGQPCWVVSSEGMVRLRH
ncbi:DUF1835 domain-containing protein [Pseudomonas sp. KNUC1026]|uniref:DUF1835 domain-containing protein n=1 Tax=Pseudomonas sp. KNUC1026 TaxID=2893890 RepID=UPI001F49051C|nr:DUF1835 domain-containing protein [Pseudomonas sp. KNUC1026]UFH50763.1 DUF1835 domain-containing protein [Pseudomonas sp. KNUC1026]